MSLVTAETIQSARTHIEQFGLRQDGYYGTPTSCCCTIGALVVASLVTDTGAVSQLVDLSSGIDEAIVSMIADYGEDSSVELDAADAWVEWRRREFGERRTGPELATWNDQEATVADVLAFYDWWSALLSSGEKVPV
jgi:hypothetical protein